MPHLALTTRVRTLVAVLLSLGLILTMLSGPARADASPQTDEDTITVSGRVTDYWGDPVVGARLASGKWDIDGYPVLTETFTDAEGVYTHGPISLEEGSTYIYLNVSRVPDHDEIYVRVSATSPTVTKDFTLLRKLVPIVEPVPKDYPYRTAVGEALTVDTGTWSSDTVVKVEWFRMYRFYGEPQYTLLPGLSGPSITVPAEAYQEAPNEDTGVYLASRLTATRTGYGDQTREERIYVEKGAQPTLVTPPTIVGTPRVGETLSYTSPKWSAEGTDARFNWYYGGNPTPVSHDRTFTLPPEAVGKQIVFGVETTFFGYEDPREVRAERTQVVTTGTLTTVTPTIAGDPTVGSTLTAKTGTWNPAPVALTFQWKRNGAPISGATASTYKLTAADADESIKVAVTGTKPGYSTQSLNTSPVKIGAGTITAPAPTIAGNPTIGSTLTVKTGAWSPSPVALTYQWKRGGVTITGATASTYKLVAADAGKTITATVTGKKTGYTTLAKTTAATPAVENTASPTSTPSPTATASPLPAGNATGPAARPSPTSLAATGGEPTLPIVGAGLLMVAGLAALLARRKKHPSRAQHSEK